MMEQSVLEEIRDVLEIPAHVAHLFGHAGLDAVEVAASGTMQIPPHLSGLVSPEYLRAAEERVRARLARTAGDFHAYCETMLRFLHASQGRHDEESCTHPA
jgi:hypothetical protein